MPRVYLCFLIYTIYVLEDNDRMYLCERNVDESWKMDVYSENCIPSLFVFKKQDRCVYIAVLIIVIQS